MRVAIRCGVMRCGASSSLPAVGPRQGFFVSAADAVSLRSAQRSDVPCEEGATAASQHPDCTRQAGTQPPERRCSRRTGEARARDSGERASVRTEHRSFPGTGKSDVKRSVTEEGRCNGEGTCRFLAVDRAPGAGRVPGESQGVRKNGAGNVRDLRFTCIFRRERQLLDRQIHREAACILPDFLALEDPFCADPPSGQCPTRPPHAPTELPKSCRTYIAKQLHTLKRKLLLLKRSQVTNTTVRSNLARQSCSPQRRPSAVASP
jgi:hypothetical protein